MNIALANLLEASLENAPSQREMHMFAAAVHISVRHQHSGYLLEDSEWVSGQPEQVT